MIALLEKETPKNRQKQKYYNKMIKSISLSNFRCFESLVIKDLKRVNIIVGKNSSGKTALLEAIFLASGGNAEVALRLKNFRGYEGVSIQADKEGYEEMWADLFYGFDIENTIELKTTGQQSYHTRRLEIYFNPNQVKSISVGDKIDNLETIPIVFNSYNESDQKKTGVVQVEGENVLIPTDSFRISTIFVSARHHKHEETAKRFSDIRKRKDDKEILKVLQSLFPFIESLSVEINAEKPMLYAGVSYLDRLIPVALLSDGVNKLLSLLCAVAHRRYGIVLIDEVENGFYYEILPDVWKALHKTAYFYRTQLFVTTHSLEALKFAIPTMQENEKEFTFLRVEKEDSKQANVKHWKANELIDALEIGVDPR